MVIGNDTAIHASLFAPGYTIAAIIANEFTEATGDVYLSSLIELGLVLFFLTMILNAARAVADPRHHQKGLQAIMTGSIWRAGISSTT